MNRVLFACLWALSVGVSAAQAFEVKSALVQKPGAYSLGVETLHGDQACARCHVAISEQWRTSSHRFSSFNNPYYATPAKKFFARHGAHRFQFCARCHDPALVAQPAIYQGQNAFASSAAHAGISCLVCHGVQGEPKPGGNAHFAVTLTDHRDRQAHGQHMMPKALTSGAVCLSCHDVTLPPAVTGDQYVHGQDDGLVWRESGYGGSGIRSPWHAAPQSCIDCHMPRIFVGRGAPAGRDGYVRSHLFVGGNTAVAALLSSANTVEQHAAFMKDTVEITLLQESPRKLAVVLYNRGIGHRFPGGVNDTNQAWLEVVARNAQGHTIAVHGALNAGRTLPLGTHLIRRLAVDHDGQPIQNRAISTIRGVAADTSLRPRWPKVVRFVVPEHAHAVRVRLLYRQFSPKYARWSCAALVDSGRRTRCESPPVTEMGRTTLRLSTEASTPHRARRTGWSRYALALSDGMAEDVLRGAQILEALHTMAPDDETMRVSLAYSQWRLGRTDRVVSLTRALTPSTTAGRFGLWIRMKALTDAYRFSEALAAGQALLRLVPSDHRLKVDVSRLQSNLGAWTSALDLAVDIVEQAPQLADGWFLRTRAFHQLGLIDEEGQNQWLRRRSLGGRAFALRKAFRRTQPNRAAMLDPIPTYTLAGPARDVSIKRSVE
ncbi:MAG: multiheme c-type cytochrome [Myxococcota bacterium]|nr:multiheme c-type cytochrome [Myxococcota bacterium]